MVNLLGLLFTPYGLAIAGVILLILIVKLKLWKPIWWVLKAVWWIISLPLRLLGFIGKKSFSSLGSSIETLTSKTLPRVIAEIQILKKQRAEKAAEIAAIAEAEKAEAAEEGIITRAQANNSFPPEVVQELISVLNQEEKIYANSKIISEGILKDLLSDGERLKKLLGNMTGIKKAQAMLREKAINRSEKVSKLGQSDSGLNGLLDISSKVDEISDRGTALSSRQLELLGQLTEMETTTKNFIISVISDLGKVRGELNKALNNKSQAMIMALPITIENLKVKKDRLAQLKQLGLASNPLFEEMVQNDDQLMQLLTSLRDLAGQQRKNIQASIAFYKELVREGKAARDNTA
jgi:hypothetical protein